MTFYDSQYFWSLMECIECYMNLFERLIKIKIDVKIGTQKWNLFIKLEVIEAN